MERKITVLHYPWSVRNPYQSLLARALEVEGINVLLKERTSWIWKFLPDEKYDILHLHWISDNVTASTKRMAVFRALNFFLFIFWLKIRRRKLVWTVHNLGHHERRQPGWERFLARRIGKIADRILIHGSSLTKATVEYLRVPKSKIVVIHHGNFDGCYSSSKDRNAIRAEEGIAPDTRVFLFFGRVRPYKGLDNLVQCFKSLPGNVRLICRGSPMGGVDLEELESLVGEDSRISLKLDFISDDELARCLELADVVVLPFRNVTTSGSLILALTYGKPTVIPRMGVIPEYVDDRCAFLFDPGDPNSLQKALESAQSATNEEIARMGEEARRRADDLGWDTIARETKRVYDSVLGQ